MWERYVSETRIATLKALDIREKLKNLICIPHFPLLILMCYEDRKMILLHHIPGQGQRRVKYCAFTACSCFLLFCPHKGYFHFLVSDSIVASAHTPHGQPELKMSKEAASTQISTIYQLSQ